jgi:hypothetical protein
VRREMIPHGGHSFERMDFAKRTFEQIALHCFDSFVLTLVLSQLLALALCFDFASGCQGVRPRQIRKRATQVVVS